MASTWNWLKGALAALALLTAGADDAAAQQTNICSTPTGLCQIDQWGWPGQECWCQTYQGPVAGRLAAVEGSRGGLSPSYSTLCSTSQGVCSTPDANPVGSTCWCANTFGMNIPGRVVAQAQGGPVAPPPGFGGGRPSQGGPRGLNEFQENALKDGCQLTFANDPSRLRTCLRQQDPRWRDALARGCQHRYSKHQEKLGICMDF